MKKLSGKTYLIAGASSGIGKNIAEYLTKVSGANVVLVARRKNIIDELAGTLPGNNIAIESDLNDLENIGDIFKKCEEKAVKLDGMVYSAGIAPLYSIQENDTIKSLETMRINAIAFAELGKYMMNSVCVNDTASVVAISSIVSVAVTNRQSAYAGSKAMLNTYVKFLAKEALGRIRVNAILPGAVETDMYQLLRNQSIDFDEKMKKNYPLGIIPPEKISKMVEYLLSEDAEFITGSLMVMDSGYLLK